MIILSWSCWSVRSQRSNQPSKTIVMVTQWDAAKHNFPSHFNEEETEKPNAQSDFMNSKSVGAGISSQALFTPRADADIIWSALTDLIMFSTSALDHGSL